VFNYDSATLRVADEKEIQMAGTGGLRARRAAPKNWISTDEKMLEGCSSELQDEVLKKLQ